MPALRVLLLLSQIAGSDAILPAHLIGMALAPSFFKDAELAHRFRIIAIAHLGLGAKTASKYQRRFTVVAQALSLVKLLQIFRDVFLFGVACAALCSNREHPQC